MIVTRKAVEQHYTEHFDKLVKRVSYSTDFSKEDAEDVVQEAYTKVLGRLSRETFHAESPEAYILVAVESCRLDHYRRYMKGGLTGGEDDAAEEPAPQARTLVSEGLLSSLTRGLSSEEDRIFNLYLSGYPQAYISKHLGVDRRKVKGVIEKVSARGKRGDIECLSSQSLT